MPIHLLWASHFVAICSCIIYGSAMTTVVVERKLTMHDYHEVAFCGVMRCCNNTCAFAKHNRNVLSNNWAIFLPCWLRLLHFWRWISGITFNVCDCFYISIFRRYGCMFAKMFVYIGFSYYLNIRFIVDVGSYRK